MGSSEWVLLTIVSGARDVDGVQRIEPFVWVVDQDRVALISTETHLMMLMLHAPIGVCCTFVG